VLQTQAGQAADEFPAALGLKVGFAEPDWQGDGDFGGGQDAVDLDDQVADLAARIADGARSGWLGVYHARRAAFDLQSIRGQIARERRKRANDEVGSDLRAILSRLDRLTRLLSAARPEG
jgi:hypothetical protein